MNKEQEKDQVLNQIKDRMPDMIQTLGYMEHQLDLVTKFTSDLLYLLTDITKLVDPSQLPLDMVERLQHVEDLVESSSLDFANLSSPMESYKLPKTKERKDEIRAIQNRYLQLVYERGLND